MDLLTPGTGLIFWQTLVFILLVFVLAKVAWKPILRALKEREDFIQESLDSAEKAKKEMKELKTNNEKLLHEAREERETILREARETAARLHEQVQAESEKNAHKIIQDARTLINMEKKAALNDVRNQVAVLSLEIAEKLIRKNLSDDNTQKELIHQFMKELKSN